MSRMRLTSSEIGKDKIMAKVTMKHGPLPMLVYTLAIPCADDWGRLSGDATEFTLQVCPALLAQVDDIETAIKTLADAGLWRLYQVGENWHIAFPRESWFKHQTYINIEKRNHDGSKIPAPPGEVWESWDSRPSNTKKRGSLEPTGEGLGALPTNPANPQGTPTIPAEPHIRTGAQPSPSPSPSPSQIHTVDAASVAEGSDADAPDSVMETLDLGGDIFAEPPRETRHSCLKGLKGDAAALGEWLEHELYPAHPRKLNFNDAWKAVISLVRTNYGGKPSALTAEKRDEILRVHRLYSERVWSHCDPSFVPHLATWINGRRWEDEPEYPTVCSPSPRDSLPTVEPLRRARKEVRAYAQ